MRPPKPHPYAFYSSGRWLLGQLYIVGWSEEGVVKAGVTMNGRQRFGPFLARGAEMLHLEAFEAGGDVAAEQRVHDALSARWPRAFASKAEAAPLLGRKGSGYLECYRVPYAEWHSALRIAKEEN